MKILSLSEFVPEYICDTVRFTGYDGDFKVSNYCGYLSDFISQIINDDTVDGAVYPKSCDSSRILETYLSKTGKFLFQICAPPVSEVGVSYYADVLRIYKTAVENRYEIKIDDVAERCALVNARNTAIRESYDNLEEITYYDYLTQIYAMLKKPLREQKPHFEISIKPCCYKKVFLVGSFFASPEVARTIENLGMKIVGDALPVSGRLSRTPEVDVGANDIYLEIAKSKLLGNTSPTHTAFKNIIKRDIAEIRKKHADGVIFAMQKYCEPYDALWLVYKKALDDIGVPYTRIICSDTHDNGRTKLIVEAFRDKL